MSSFQLNGFRASWIFVSSEKTALVDIKVTELGNYYIKQGLNKGGMSRNYHRL